MYVLRPLVYLVLSSAFLAGCGAASQGLAAPGRPVGLVAVRGDSEERDKLAAALYAEARPLSWTKPGEGARKLQLMKQVGATQARVAGTYLIRSCDDLAPGAGMAPLWELYRIIGTLANQEQPGLDAGARGTLTYGLMSQAARFTWKHDEALKVATCRAAAITRTAAAKAHVEAEIAALPPTMAARFRPFLLSLLDWMQANPVDGATGREPGQGPLKLPAAR